MEPVGYPGPDNLGHGGGDAVNTSEHPSNASGTPAEHVDEATATAHMIMKNRRMEEIKAAARAAAGYTLAPPMFHAPVPPVPIPPPAAGAMVAAAAGAAMAVSHTHTTQWHNRSSPFPYPVAVPLQSAPVAGETMQPLHPDHGQPYPHQIWTKPQQLNPNYGQSMATQLPPEQLAPPQPHSIQNLEQPQNLPQPEPEPDRKLEFESELDSQSNIHPRQQPRMVGRSSEQQELLESVDETNTAKNDISALVVASRSDHEPQHSHASERQVGEEVPVKAVQSEVLPQQHAAEVDRNSAVTMKARESVITPVSSLHNNMLECAKVGNRGIGNLVTITTSAEKRPTPGSMLNDEMPASLDQNLCGGDSRTTHVISSPAAAHDAWARNLVGRDWEIYWEDDGGAQNENVVADYDGEGDAANANSPERKKRRLDVDNATKDGKSIEIQQSKQRGHTDENVDDNDGDSDEEEIADWYDATVTAYDPKSDPAKPFRLKFAGDDDTVYEMNLRQELVRPSARAWVRRSRALLDFNLKKGGGEEDAEDSDQNEVVEVSQEVGAMEENLPHSTAGLDDTRRFADVLLRADNELYHAEKVERRRMRALRLLVEDQVALRPKLAPIVADHVEDEDAEGGEDDSDPHPTEELIDYLRSKLLLLQGACDWYLKTSEEIWDTVMREDGDTSGKKLEMADETIHNSVADGVSHLSKLVSVETTRAAAEAERKRGRRSGVSTAPSVAAPQPTRRGRRKTARRRPRDASEILGGVADGVKRVEREGLSESIAPGSIEPLATRCATCTRWYVRVMARLLSDIVNDVWVPVRTWTKQVENMVNAGGFSMDSASGTNADDDNDDSRGEGAEEAASESKCGKKQYFSVEDVLSCIAELDNNKVLRHVNMAKPAAKIKNKLEAILRFEAEAWQAVGRCTEEPAGDIYNSARCRQEDEITVSLRQLIKKVSSGNEHLINMDPIGRRSTQSNYEARRSLPSAPLTRKVLYDALTIRQWTLDLFCAERRRERISFVQGVMTQAPSLPHLPSLPTALPDPGLNVLAVSISPSASIHSLMMRLPSLNTSAYSFGHISSSYERAAEESRDPSAETENAISLRTVKGVHEVMQQLRQTPALSLMEEKLAVRLDVLKWNECVADVIAHHGDQKLDKEKETEAKREKPSYEIVSKLEGELSAILDGKSQTRLSLTSSLRPNMSVEKEVRSFAHADVDSLCGKTAEAVRRLHGEVAAWKDRADAVLAALEAFGNMSAMKQDQEDHTSDANSNVVIAPTVPKGFAMVDFKRVADLISEHDDGLCVSFEEEYKRLRTVSENALAWTEKVEHAINNSTSGSDLRGCLSLLERTREDRPKGLIIHPARHVVDSWAEGLGWYCRIIEAMEKLAEVPEGGQGVETQTAFPDLVEQLIHPLLLEGSEILQYSTTCDPKGVTPSFVKNHESTLISTLKSSNRNRPLSLTKLKAHPLGEAILESMVNDVTDAKNGCPIFFCRLLCWRIIVREFILKSRGEESHWEDENSAANCHVSIEDARAIYVNGDLANDKMTKHNTLSKMVKIEVGEELLSLIRNAERVEKEATDLIRGCQEAVCNAFHRQDSVRQHLALLKTIHSNFKSLNSGGAPGLKLSSDLEYALDRKIKDMSWMNRTFNYPILYGDEHLAPEAEKKPCAAAPGVSSEDGSSSQGSDGGEEEISCSKGGIPWDILAGLYEKSPLAFDPSGKAKSEGLEADLIRVCLRVRELHLSAAAWQDNVTDLIPLSIRGLKRRSRSYSAPGKDEGAQASVEKSKVLAVHQLEKIVKNSILRKVIMPRKSAVCNVLSKAKQLKTHLATLFEADDDGYGVDKAPYPVSNSLICDTGQFLIYRLTTNPLYDHLQSSVKEISDCADELLVKTQEKVTFDWIVSAISWVDGLQQAVRENSASYSVEKKLVVRCQDARKILADGFSLFLGVSDDVRKTLARYKVYLSTNKQTWKLSLVIGKGGANHSAGGSVLRWTVLLFDCLRGDVARLEEWEERALDFLKSTTPESVSSRSFDTDELLDNHTTVCSLIKEAHDSLMIEPDDNTMKALREYKVTLDPEAEKLSSLKRKREETRYNSIQMIVKDRVELLESLMARKRQCTIRNVNCSPYVTKLSECGTIRDKSRSFLSQSFRKGMHMLGMEVDKERTSCDLASFKAWELELAIFNKCSNATRAGHASSEYRAKVRSLRHNLEDVKNPTLCPRVLLGKISVNELVDMSPEALASRRVKQNREKAEKEARKNVVLTPSLDKKVAGCKAAVEVGIAPVKGHAISIKGIEKSAQGSSKEPVTQDKKPVMSMKTILNKAASKPANDSVDKMTTQVISEETGPDTTYSPVTPSPTMDPPVESQETQVTSLPKVGDFPPKSDPVPNTGLRQSAPGPCKVLPSVTAVGDCVDSSPPLVGKNILPLHGSTPLSPSARQGRDITSLSGREKFSFTITGLKTSFSSCLFMESTNKYNVDAFLPDSFCDKGRLPVEEFNRFISGKIDGGKWTVAILRLSSIVAENMHNYKRFYKEYEAKKRIAMFTVGKETKLFLVTPRFIPDAKCLRGKTTSRTSTYAVILTKEKLRRNSKHSPTKTNRTPSYGPN